MVFITRLYYLRNHTNILPISKQVSFLPLALLECINFDKINVHCTYAMLEPHIRAATLRLIRSDPVFPLYETYILLLNTLLSLNTNFFNAEYSIGPAFWMPQRPHIRDYHITVCLYV